MLTPIHVRRADQNRSTCTVGVSCASSPDRPVFQLSDRISSSTLLERMWMVDLSGHDAAGHAIRPLPAPV